MYGYIKAIQPELKVREQTYYRALYCGLCRSLGHCTGQCSRLTLSYDFTFLAMLRLALRGESPEINPHHCLLHPFKKRPMAEEHLELNYAAYASAIMLYYKVMDDRADEKGKQRLRARLTTPYVKKLRRRANRYGYCGLDTQVERLLKDLSELEATCPRSVDQPAELFGKVMAKLLSFDFFDKRGLIAHELGFHLGRWIYLADAIDDFEDDLKNGRYNPFACLWQDGVMTEERRAYLEKILTRELVAMENALDLAEEENGDRDLWGVIRNILYLGMPATAHLILFPDCTAEDTRKRKKQITKGNAT